MDLLAIADSDPAGVLDALGEGKAVVVGHDWGALMAWHCDLLHPDRFFAVVALSVSFTPRSPAPPTQLIRQMSQDTFFYMRYFQEPGMAEAERATDVHRSLRLILYDASGDAPESA